MKTNRVVRGVVTLLKGVVAFYLLFAAIIIASQDVMIFPMLPRSALFGRKSTAPQGVEVLKAKAEDGHVATVWRVRPGGARRRPVAILFHGNYEQLGDFIHMQYWMESLGVTSYAIEYRGFDGRWSGWPSEAGFYRDADAVMKLVLTEESIEPRDVLVFGSSVGTGTAAYLAQKHSAGTLVLLSPYATLEKRAAEQPLTSSLIAFLRYRFPTEEYVANLRDTCLILIHGKRDSTIGFHHAEMVARAYRGTRPLSFLAAPDGNHYNTLTKVRNAASAAILGCSDAANRLAQDPSGSPPPGVP